MDALQLDDPDRLGPYRLEGRLGAGPGGRVYLGRSPGDRLAAVRLVDPRLTAEAGFRERLDHELAAVRQARVPWAAMVLDAGPAAPRPWIATEFVPGATLDHVVATSGPLPGPALGDLAGRLAEALATLHAAGIVHGDLDPSDVVLAPDGPRLADLGIAGAVRSVGGACTAPERATGGDAGFASDVYSLAATVAAAAGPVTSGSAAPGRTALPPGLRALLEPCLSADPAQRPPAAAVAAGAAALAARGTGAWQGAVAGAWQEPGSRTGGLGRSGAWFAGIAAFLVVALIAVGVVLVPGGSAPAGPVARPAVSPIPGPPTSARPPASALPSSSAPTSASSLPLPSPSAPTPALIPSSLPGWPAAVSTTRNAGYDVPPTWAPQSPTLIRGFMDAAGERVVMSGVAMYEAAAPSPCPGFDERYVLAWSGVTGAPTDDTAAAAAGVATLWSGAFDDLDVPGAPQVVLSPATDVAAAGGRGSHVVAEIAMPAGSCGSPRKAVHAVAVPSGTPGESVVLVLLAERDVPGAVTNAEVGLIASTLRPAGLDERCDPTRDVLGSWC